MKAPPAPCGKRPAQLFCQAAIPADKAAESLENADGNTRQRKK